MTMLCTFVYWGVRYVNNLISKGLFFNPTYLTLPKKKKFIQLNDFKFFQKV